MLRAGPLASTFIIGLLGLGILLKEELLLAVGLGVLLPLSARRRE